MKTAVLSTLGRFNQCVCVGGGGGGAVCFRPIQPVGGGGGAVCFRPIQLVGRRGCCSLTALSMFKKGEGALYLHSYIGNHVASCIL